METSQDILVIILAVALAVLLVLSIVIAALTIKVLTAVRRIADKAEHAAENADQITQTIVNMTGSLSAVRLFQSVVNMMSKSHSGKK
jgi:hypothetical protein